MNAALLNERPASHRTTHWRIVFLLACVVFNGPSRWLNNIGLGDLTGDFSFRLSGRQWHIPTACSLVLSLLEIAIGALI